MEDQPIAYIDRIYDDPDFPAPQPWPRRRRWFADEPEWHAACDRGTAETFEEAGFDTVDDALAWARERAQIVLVRLGSSEETVYSAGAVRANEFVDGSGNDYLEWPPDNWPDYKGPGCETRKFEETEEPALASPRAELPPNPVERTKPPASSWTRKDPSALNMRSRTASGSRAGRRPV